MANPTGALADAAETSSAWSDLSMELSLMASFNIGSTSGINSTTNLFSSRTTPQSSPNSPILFAFASRKVTEYALESSRTADSAEAERSRGIHERRSCVEDLDEESKAHARAKSLIEARLSPVLGFIGEGFWGRR